MIRKDLSKSCHSDRPLSRLAKCIFVIPPDIHFSDLSSPSFAACTTLVPKSSEKIALITKQVCKPYDVKTIGPLAIIIFVFISFNLCRCTAVVMMVHYIMSQFTTAASQTVGPDVGCRIHEHPCRIERRCIDKN